MSGGGLFPPPPREHRVVTQDELMGSPALMVFERFLRKPEDFYSFSARPSESEQQKILLRKAEICGHQLSYQIDSHQTRKGLRNSAACSILASHLIMQKCVKSNHKFQFTAHRGFSGSGRSHNA